MHSNAYAAATAAASATAASATAAAIAAATSASAKTPRLPPRKKRLGDNDEDRNDENDEEEDYDTLKIDAGAHADPRKSAHRVPALSKSATTPSKHAGVHRSSTAGNTKGSAPSSPGSVKRVRTTPNVATQISSTSTKERNPAKFPVVVLDDDDKNSNDDDDDHNSRGTTKHRAAAVEANDDVEMEEYMAPMVASTMPPVCCEATRGPVVVCRK